MTGEDKSLPDTGPTCPDGETCEPLALMQRGRENGANLEWQEGLAYPLRGEGRWGGERQCLLISSAAASPAKTSQSPASGQA